MKFYKKEKKRKNIGYYWWNITENDRIAKDCTRV